jgi:hypothetical protein
VFKVKAYHQTPPSTVEGRIPFHIDNSPVGIKNRSPQVLFHCPVDPFYASGFSRIVQEDFRKNTMEGRRAVPGGGGGPVPVIAVLGKLIAGNNRPCGQVYPLPGQEQFGDCHSQGGKPFMNIHDALKTW